MVSTVVTLGGFISFIDLAGVLANAILGGLAARLARLDIVGFITLAVLSGLGGGMVRDTLLQRGTPVALTDPYYLLVAICGAVIAFLIPFERTLFRLLLDLLEALSLGCWAAAGAQKALDAGLRWLPAVMLGTITAVGGGMFRDVFLRKVPTIFGGNTLYATNAFVASLEMVILSELGFPTIGSLVAILSGATLSLLARRFGWTLPTEVRLRKSQRLAGWWSGRGRGRGRRGGKPGGTNHERP
ncbi:MAG: TRIC cation channel family protein [Myxococcaceae bacterium]